METLISRPVFINLFAPAEPSANVCVAHVTLRNDSSVCPTFCNKPVKQWYSGIATTAHNCGYEFRPRQFRSVSAEP